MKAEDRFILIAGPCVIESWDLLLETAQKLKQVCERLSIEFIFKTSYDKANRSSLTSYRGPGIDRGLKLIADLKDKLSIPVITDVHSVQEVSIVSQVVDYLQIPAFLCRQTDLILATSQTGKPVNIKKGQFLAPWDVKNVIEKFTSTGNHNLMITERGSCFGYNNLVVDFRSFPIMRAFGYPVIFDVTHSLQLPGGKGSCSDGQSQYALPLARAAVACGVDGLFIETHPEPAKALCDGPNMVKLSEISGLLDTVHQIHKICKSPSASSGPSNSIQKGCTP